METMTNTLRWQMQMALLERGLNQTDLANKLGMKRQYLSAVLTGKRGNLPESWEKILSELGYEVIAVPKGKLADVKRLLVE